MRLLADQSFPASVDQNRTLDLEIVRWSGERVSDVDLLQECASIGAAGVLLLGVQALLFDEFRLRVIDLALYAGATLEDNPFIAARAIGNLLPILAKEARPGTLHILLARELRPWEEFHQARMRARS